MKATPTHLFPLPFPPSNSHESLFPLEHITATMESIRKHLWVKDGVGGVARYLNDEFQVQPGVEYGPGRTGNPWIICTLWLAEWDIWSAKKVSDLYRARESFNWVVRHAALPSGVLAEQVHPTTGEPLSVSPLAWSHTTYLSVVQKFEDKRRELEGLKIHQVRKSSSAGTIASKMSF